MTQVGWIVAALLSEHLRIDIEEMECLKRNIETSVHHKSSERADNKNTKRNGLMSTYTASGRVSYMILMPS